jgi:cysteinyl-tRNA synthetase, unknown class
MKPTTVLTLLFFCMILISACREKPEDRDYRQNMCDFVMAMRAHTDTIEPNFLLIPQNGEELVTAGDGHETPPANDYLAAIDGQGREDLLYGYNADNKPTPDEDAAYMQAHLQVAESNGIEVLVTDYCWNEAFMADSYQENQQWDFISFAAPSRGLDVIPEYPPVPHNENEEDVTSLADARNFLYLLDPVRYETRTAYLDALDATTYDLFIIDAFYDDQMLTAAEVAALQTKPNGARRLVIAYMSIGEAEDYRYYWQEGWKPGSPEFIERENPDWEGNYKVRYWDPEWQAVIFGTPNAYLDRILDAGFDGAYLDIIDAYEYFE